VSVTVKSASPEAQGPLSERAILKRIAEVRQMNASIAENPDRYVAIPVPLELRDWVPLTGVERKTTRFRARRMYKAYEKDSLNDFKPPALRSNISLIPKDVFWFAARAVSYVLGGCTTLALIVGGAPVLLASLAGAALFTGIAAKPELAKLALTSISRRTAKLVLGRYRRAAQPPMFDHGLGREGVSRYRSTSYRLRHRDDPGTTIKFGISPEHARQVLDRMFADGAALRNARTLNYQTTHLPAGQGFLIVHAQQHLALAHLADRYGQARSEFDAANRLFVSTSRERRWAIRRLRIWQVARFSLAAGLPMGLGLGVAYASGVLTTSLICGSLAVSGLGAYKAHDLGKWLGKDAIDFSGLKKVRSARNKMFKMDQEFIRCLTGPKLMFVSRTAEPPEPTTSLAQRLTSHLDREEANLLRQFAAKVGSNNGVRARLANQGMKAISTGNGPMDLLANAGLLVDALLTDENQPPLVRLTQASLSQMTRLNKELFEVDDHIAPPDTSKAFRDGRGASI
jgi:hypothetical protein